MIFGGESYIIDIHKNINKCRGRQHCLHSDVAFTVVLAGHQQFPLAVVKVLGLLTRGVTVKVVGLAILLRRAGPRHLLLPLLRLGALDVFALTGGIMKLEGPPPTDKRSCKNRIIVKGLDMR